jgi:hypothetical protein
MRSSAVLLIAYLFAAGRTAGAQSAVLSGAVFRDSLSHPLAGAEVWLPELQRRTETNILGDFRLANLAAGTYTIIVRHIGYAPVQDTLRLVTDGETERDFILLQQVTVLASVSASAPASKALTAHMQGFEARRAQGFGHFITAPELRKNDDRTLGGLLSAVPGTMLTTWGSSMFLTSSRGAAGIMDLLPQRAIPSDERSPRGCWVQIFLDGVQFFSTKFVAQPPANSRTKPVDDPTALPVPDMNQFFGRDFEAVEYYAGGSQIPPQYNNTGAACGTLLLWTRER